MGLVWARQGLDMAHLSSAICDGVRSCGMRDMGYGINREVMRGEEVCEARRGEVRRGEAICEAICEARRYVTRRLASIGGSRRGRARARTTRRPRS